MQIGNFAERKFCVFSRSSTLYFSPKRIPNKVNNERGGTFLINLLLRALRVRFSKMRAIRTIFGSFAEKDGLWSPRHSRRETRLWMATARAARPRMRNRRGRKARLLAYARASRAHILSYPPTISLSLVRTHTLANVLDLRFESFSAVSVPVKWSSPDWNHRACK